MTTTTPIPEPHIALINTWAKLRIAMAEFSDLAHAVQLHCQHTHAVQYNPNHFPYKRHDCQEHPFRVCVACGLKEKAKEQLDPNSFSDIGPLCGSEILAVYDQGYRANHYILPSLPREHRLDGLLAPTDD